MRRIAPAPHAALQGVIHPTPSHGCSGGLASRSRRGLPGIRGHAIPAVLAAIAKPLAWVGIGTAAAGVTAAAAATVVAVGVLLVVVSGDGEPSGVAPAALAPSDATSDAHGVSRLSVFDGGEPGDVLEWREAGDCRVRYRVTSAPRPAAGGQGGTGDDMASR